MKNGFISSNDTSLSPYLSIVATSRNDDHGGDPLIRTQIFITNIARQCEKYKLLAELIIVDWNPVPDRPGLAAVLDVPTDSTYLQAKVITVPTGLHNRIKYSEKLSLFQMIAKNVGIRRARGQFILATNIDILFSNELIQFIARQKLNPLKQYRVDRYDIHSGLSPAFSLDETLEYAWANLIRTNRRYQPDRLVKHLYGDELFKSVCIPESEYCEWNEGVVVVSEDGVWEVRPERSVNMSHLHTNACGDFTLLSRKGWDAIRGYPEFEAFSFNIDSLGMLAAHYAGYTEVALLPPCVCFHIEHGVGSGWTPEGEKKLFDRLRQAEILNPEWSVLKPLVDEMRTKETALEFNHAGWGMADFVLPEQVMGDTGEISQDKLKQLELQAEVREVTAMQPSFDLDRLTLAHERRVLKHERRTLEHERRKLVSIRKIEKAQIYTPDIYGNYHEDNSITHNIIFQQTCKVVFRLENYKNKFPLRFDPCGSSGIVNIYSIVAFDVAHKKEVWKIDNNHRTGLVIAGTAKFINPGLTTVNLRPEINADISLQGKALTPINRVLLSQRSSVRLIKDLFPLGLKIRLKNLLIGSGQSLKQSDPERSSKQPEELDSIQIFSSGSDPQIFLLPISENIGFPLLITIEMKFTPTVQ